MAHSRDQDVTSSQSQVPDGQALPDEDELTLVTNILTEHEYWGKSGGLEEANLRIARALQATDIVCDADALARWNIARATALRLGYEQNRVTSDIEEAQHILECVVSSTAEATPAHILALYGLGRVFEERYEWSLDQELSDSAFGKYAEAISQLSDQAPCSTDFVTEITVHHARCMGLLRETTALVSQLAESTALLTRSLYSLPEGNPLRVCALEGLSQNLIRWALVSNPTDMNRLAAAGKLCEQALSVAAPFRRAPLLHLTLAKIGYEVYCKSGEDTLLHAVVTRAEEALALAHQIRTPKWGILATARLGMYYYSLFEAEGSFHALTRSIDCLQTARNAEFALDKTNNNLALALCIRFRETGRLSDIDGAIEAAQRAIDAAKREARLAPPLIMLGVARTHRYLLDQDDSDYRAARQNLEDGVRLAKSLCSLRGAWSGGLLYLSILLSAHFHMTRLAEDLNLALEHLRLAVTLVEDMQSSHPFYLSRLGECLSTHFQWTSSSITDVEESIITHQTALSLASLSNSERHTMLWRYGKALCLRSATLHKEVDMEEAIKAFEAAWHGARVSHHCKQSLYLSELATLHSHRYQALRQPQDLETALEQYIHSSELREGLSQDRLLAAIKGAELAHEYGRVPIATRLYSTALSLLPRIAWLGLNAHRRHAKLASTAAQIACDAAASTLMSGELERAVELLEEGKTVLWRSLLQLRTDLKDLDTAAPGLASEIREVGMALEHDDTATQEPSEKVAEQRAQRRRCLAERWDSLLQDVRQIEGFRSFLRPLPFFELRNAAEAGPIVILNVSKYQSDALIITTSEPIRHVPLHGLDLGTVRQLSYIFSQALRLATDNLGCRFLERTILEVARRLWHGGLSNVAVALGECQQATVDSLLRVWWMPSGPFNVLPIHCAGPYAIGQKGVPDLFISSYTTTLSSLLMARASPSQSFFQCPEMLAIGVPEVPRFRPLPNAGQEMQIIAASPFANTVSFLFGEDATISKTTDALQDVPWFHCCSHGSWNPERPLESAFHLTDGPLTLSSIVQMRLQNADFAFLSACHTARQASDLPDEALHLAAGLQVAGFRGVLGTAWAMAERDGPALARLFYHYLTVNGRSIDPCNAAEALHRSVRSLRGTGMPLYRWASFVHFGI